MRHIAAHYGNLILTAENAVALAAHKFPYVRVFLVRHNAGARGKGIREMNEAEIGAHILAAIRRELI